MIHFHSQKIDNLWCSAALEEGKIHATAFAVSEEDALMRLLKEFPYNTILQTAQETNAFTEVLRTIKAICDGKDVSFSFELAMSHLSIYTQNVLRLTSLVPTGYVTTYGDLAKVMGGSPRSAGRVMATNPFAPLIPCHRVVTAKLTLGGYGFGLKRKWDILKRENRKHSDILRIRIHNKTLRLFPVDMVKP